MKKTKKMNNKGFSLVELIIVVAIMAVLVGVLAPSYMKYVEQSRQSADLDTYDTMLSAVEIYAANPNVTWTDGSITVDADGEVLATHSLRDALIDAAIMSTSTDPTTGAVTDSYKAKMKSTNYSTVSITSSKGSDGVITFTFGDTNGSALETALGR